MKFSQSYWFFNVSKRKCLVDNSFYFVMQLKKTLFCKFFLAIRVCNSLNLRYLTVNLTTDDLLKLTFSNKKR